MKPLHICYVLPQLDIGGSESHVIRLAHGLRQRGHDAEIVCVFEEGKLGPIAREKGIPVTALRTKHGWGLHALSELYRHFKSNRPDIVHTYLFGLHFFAGLPARLNQVPVILSSRRDVELSQTKKVLWMEKFGNLFVDRVICCSEAVKQWVLNRENLSANRLTTIYNGVDLSEFQITTSGVRQEFGIPAGAPVIGTVANFSLKKGYSYLLETAQIVLNECPNAWFLLVGTGPLEDEMKQKAGKSPFAKKIIFAGSRSDIPALISSMDVFVFSSLWEGLPNAVLEAMSLGRPVISTPVGGLPEVLKTEQEGILIPYKDASAMAEAILKLLKTPQQAKAMGKKAQEKIQKDFSLDRMLNDYEKFYGELMGSHSYVSTEREVEPAAR